MDFAGVYGVSGQRFCEKARMSCRNSYNLEYGSAFQHQTFVVRDICCKSCSEADSGDGDQLWQVQFDDMDPESQQNRNLIDNAPGAQATDLRTVRKAFVC